MKRTILINQQAVVESGLDLDFIDLVIFDYFKDFAQSPGIMKVECADGLHFWISHAKIREDLPLLGIKTNAGIIARVDHLVQAGILIKSDDCEKFGKTLYRWGENYEKLIALPLNETEHPSKNFEGTPKQNFRGPLKESLGDSIIIDNQINDTLLSLRSKSVGKTAEKLCLFPNSKFYDERVFASFFAGPEFAGIDIGFYFHQIADWSLAGMKKKHDWIATARNWIRSDIQSGKVKRLNNPASLVEQYMEDRKKWQI